MSDSLLTETGLDLGSLRQAIQEEYTAVAQEPGRGYHFHTGRPLASMLGYHDDWLEGLPEGSIASFAGTGNPFRIGQLQPPPGKTRHDIVPVKSSQYIALFYRVVYCHWADKAKYWSVWLI